MEDKMPELRAYSLSIFKIELHNLQSLNSWATSLLSENEKKKKGDNAQVNSHYNTFDFK